MGSHSEKHDQTILNKGGEEVCMSIEAWSCNLIKQHVIPIIGTCSVTLSLPRHTHRTPPDHQHSTYFSRRNTLGPIAKLPETRACNENCSTERSDIFSESIESISKGQVTAPEVNLRGRGPPRLGNRPRVPSSSSPNSTKRTREK